MRSSFYHLQKIIKQRKVPFVFFFVLLFGGFAYLASQTKLTEDASAILPQSENSKDINAILQNIELTERIYFNIYLKDTNNIDQNGLIQFAQELKDSLSLFEEGEIKEIQIGVQQQSIEDVSEYVLKNLPFLLKESDYQYFDSLLLGDGFEKSFLKKYKTLMSPAAAFTKQLIVKDPAGLSLTALERLRNFQLGNEINIQKGFLFSEDGKHLLGAISLGIPSSKTAALGTFLAKLDKFAKALEQKYDNEIVLEYFGGPVVASGNASQIKKDIILTISMAVVMVVLLIALFYRSKRLYLIIFLPAGLAVIISMAIIYIIQGEVSAIALGLGSVLVGISIDYVLHIFTHHQETNSVKMVLKDVSEPILISAATTASAFFGLWIVSAPALQDMGLFAGISILFSALLSLIIVPLFLKDQKQKIRATNHFFRRKVQQFTVYPFHEKKWLIISLIALTPVFYYFSNSVVFQGDMNAINYRSEETKRAEAHLNEISQISQRNVFVVSKASNLQEALKQSENLESKLKQENDWGILNYTQLSDLLPSETLQKSRLQVWNAYWTEERKQLLFDKIANVEQQYGFRENSFSEFEQWMQTSFQSISSVDIEIIKKAFLKELVQGEGDNQLVITQIKTTTADKKMLNTNLSVWLPDGLFLIDKEFLTAQFVDQLKTDFQKLVNLSLLIVFLIIWMAFGRIELAIITFLPLSLSWIFTTGLMSLFGLEFNIVNIIITTFIFGLGIDYCIFITRGLMQEYKYGGSRLESFKTSILFSAITSIVGIGVLIFAQHPALKSMAFVTIIGLLSVLLLSFSLQPLMFSWLVNIRKNESRLSPVTAFNLAGSITALLVFSLGSLLNTIVGFFFITLTGGNSRKTRMWFHYLLKWTTKFMVYVMFNVKKKVVGYQKEKFEKPSVIISNHQSHIDIMLMLMLHPKIILLTNDWVQRNFFYGKIVKMADFYPILDHLQDHVDLLKKKVDDGYSIMIFPEGTRSATGKIGRFHKGAFYLAEQLKLDILPIILHGPGDCITKGEPFLKSGSIEIHIHDKISANDPTFGKGYVDRSKGFRKWYQLQYDSLRHQLVAPAYLKKRLDMQYIYKGPVLEWYVKIKMKLEKNYRFFHEHISEDAKIVDLGCGNGMMSFMLALLSEKRHVIGVDYDEEKIQVAQQILARQSLLHKRMNFYHADLNSWEFEKADVYILADVLHYMTEDEQKNAIENACKNLNINGLLIIRDADTDMAIKHEGTKFSEWQSTKLIGFNKTRKDEKKLYFGSAKDRIQLMEKLGMTVDIIDETKLNSNVILMGRK